MAGSSSGVRLLAHRVAASFPLVQGWDVPADVRCGTHLGCVRIQPGQRFGAAAVDRLNGCPGPSTRGRCTSFRPSWRTLWCPSETQGASSNYTNLPVEPADRALGRSRGGLSTKIHALTDDRTRPVTVILTGGQAGDNPQLVPLLDLHRRQSPPGQSHRFRLLADRAYSHPSTRQQLRHRRIAHTIPERQDQKDRRKAKGSKGGRPP